MAFADDVFTDWELIDECSNIKDLTDAEEIVIDKMKQCFLTGDQRTKLANMLFKRGICVLIQVGETRLE